jgi:hypothetical protein
MSPSTVCNDIWCVAIKSDGRMRHYETTQLKLAFNGALGINMPNHLAPCGEEVDGAFPRRVGD